jgi:hypothetical protein
MPTSSNVKPVSILWSVRRLFINFELQWASSSVGFTLNGDEDEGRYINWLVWVWVCTHCRYYSTAAPVLLRHTTYNNTNTKNNFNLRQIWVMRIDCWSAVYVSEWVSEWVSGSMQPADNKRSMRIIWNTPGDEWVSEWVSPYPVWCRGAMPFPFLNHPTKSSARHQEVRATQPQLWGPNGLNDLTTGWAPKRSIKYYIWICLYQHAFDSVELSGYCLVVWLRFP